MFGDVAVKVESSTDERIQTGGGKEGVALAGDHIGLQNNLVFIDAITAQGAE